MSICCYIIKLEETWLNLLQGKFEVGVFYVDYVILKRYQYMVTLLILYYSEFGWGQNSVKWAGEQLHCNEGKCHCERRALVANDILSNTAIQNAKSVSFSLTFFTIEYLLSKENKKND